MKNLDKVGFLILVLVWPLSYYLKHIDPIKNQLIVDYFITIGYCIGTAIISYSYGIKESKRVTRILFYYVISIFSILIVLTYLIDLLIDPIFETTKVIWSIISTACISLCIYLFSQQ